MVAGPRSLDDRPRWLRPGTLLAAVAVLHAASPLLILGTHWWFGIDETVYLSQLNAHVPANLFTAPRARGSTLIAAPMTLLTTSIAAVRVWLAFLAGPALYAAFRPWLRLRPGYLTPMAALLFSTLWMVIYYTFEVIPNEWDALATLAACGYLLLYLRDGRRTYLAATTVTVAVVGLMRPSDALYAGAALCLCALFVRVPRRRRIMGALWIVLGAGAGAAEWVVEAYTRYGGLAHRISAALGENGDGGPHFSGLAQARTLAGPILCGHGCHPHPAAIDQLWWAALALLVVVALATAQRRGSLTSELVPVAVGLAAAAQYIFTIPYSAPRFLIPAYALLSIPAASGFSLLLRIPRAGWSRAALAAGFTLALVAHLGLQVHVLAHDVAPTERATARQLSAETARLRELGIRSPCLVLGASLSQDQVAYALGCSNQRSGRTVRDAIKDGVAVVRLSTYRPPMVYGTN